MQNPQEGESYNDETRNLDPVLIHVRILRNVQAQVITVIAAIALI